METILNEARKGQKATCFLPGTIVLLTTVIIVIVARGLMLDTDRTEAFFIVLAVTIIFAVIPWVVCLAWFIRRFRVYLNPMQSEWWQLIEELGYDQEIIRTIDDEIRHPSTIRWERHNTFFRITPNWLIAIENSGWVAIRKRNDLIKVSRTDGKTNGGSMSPTLDFQFTNGKKAILWFGWDNDATQMAIMSHLKEVMPHVRYEDLT